MTLEEAIKHCEEVAEENEKEFRICPYPTEEDCNGNQDCRCLEDGEGKGCLRCAAEHRQLAEWLKELKERREQDVPDTNVGDTISRQAAIDVIDKIFPADPMRNDYTQGITCGAALAMEYIKQLPSAQSDGISLEWIDKHLEWLNNCDNDFAQLAKVSIRAMVELWKKDRIQ